MFKKSLIMFIIILTTNLKIQLNNNLIQNY